jgi:protocatechuate 3,4-dioxygenase beta subunit
MSLLAFTALLALALAHDDDLSPSRHVMLRVGGRASVSKRFVDEVNVSAVVLAPFTTEGPYFATLADYADDSNLTAAAVADNRRAVLDGVPLRLTFNVYDVVGSVGTELANATVFLWHCDTSGVYGAVSLAQNPTNKEDTVGKKWLRSTQRTDANGVVTFNTVVPGWYGGRTLHFHVRVRLPSATSDSSFVITTQLMFQDALQIGLKQIAPYAALTTPYVQLAQDMIYTQASASLGDRLLLNLVGDFATGFTSTFALGIDRTATAAPGGGMGMPPRGSPPIRPGETAAAVTTTAATTTTTTTAAVVSETSASANTTLTNAAGGLAVITHTCMVVMVAAFLR